jgi:hypothetical protein
MIMKCKFEHDGHCCNCGATQYMIECKQPCETIVPMTNADRIRAMSDEELYKFLSQYVFYKVCDEGCDACTYNGDCDKRLLDWLKQPAEE